MARKSRKVQNGVSESAMRRVVKGGVARGSGALRNLQNFSGLDADWDASWNSAWDISWAAARDAARESARLAARAAAAEATRIAALRAARLAWRNPANDLRQQALIRVVRRAALMGRKLVAGVVAVAPGAMRLVLVGIAWGMVYARRLGVRLLALLPVVVKAVRVVFVWLVRSVRRIAAWGSKEVVDVRPRTRIL